MKCGMCPNLWIFSNAQISHIGHTQANLQSSVLAFSCNYFILICKCNLSQYKYMNVLTFMKRRCISSPGLCKLICMCYVFTVHGDWFAWRSGRLCRVIQKIKDSWLWSLQIYWCTNLVKDSKKIIFKKWNIT